MTVSSPWNSGMNLSPRIISDLFNGRKRHSTLILHSALASAIVRGKTVGALSKDKEKFLKTLKNRFSVQPFPRRPGYRLKPKAMPTCKASLVGEAFRRMDNYEFFWETTVKLIEETQNKDKKERVWSCFLFKTLRWANSMQLNGGEQMESCKSLLVRAVVSGQAAGSQKHALHHCHPCSLTGGGAGWSSDSNPLSSAPLSRGDRGARGRALTLLLITGTIIILALKEKFRKLSF